MIFNHFGFILFQSKSMIGPHEISSTSSAADSQLHKRGIQTSPDGKTRLNHLELFDCCCSPDGKTRLNHLELFSCCRKADLVQFGRVI
jgi:hypothetical protein